MEAMGKWVATWGTSEQETEPSNMPPVPGLRNNTLRQIIHVTLGGKWLRFTFSNVYGNGPVTMGYVHAAPSAGGASIAAKKDGSLSFHGKPSVTIPAGEEVSSDPFEYDLASMSVLAVSVFFTEMPSLITGHPGSRTTSYITPGNAVSAPDLPQAVPVVHWYILAGLEVRTSGAAAAVAILGDSITDGRGSTTDGNDRWPDVLSRRLQANGATADIAVLNSGIGGNAVVSGGLGPTALSRLDRDVINRSGVRWLILMEGVNDIGGAKGPDGLAAATRELTAAYARIIGRAHAAGIRVFGATLTPFKGHSYYTPESEAARQSVNQWIRTGGTFDAVIDMDAAVRDPASPQSLLTAADSGDNLHLSPEGYRMLASAVDMGLFER